MMKLNITIKCSISENVDIYIDGNYYGYYDESQMNSFPIVIDLADYGAEIEVVFIDSVGNAVKEIIKNE